MILEVCADSLEGAIIAAENGADRIELNSALKLGGLTPSIGLVKAVKREIELPVIAMLRPRAGGFCYSEKEFFTMQQDAFELIDAGVDGIALGILTEAGEVDLDKCKLITGLAEDLDWVFHRAFDDLKERGKAIEGLITAGLDRILTAGGCRTALDGINEISELRSIAGDKITIMPGGGINSENVKYILERTGCLEVHGSFSEKAIKDRDSLFGTMINKIVPVEIGKMREVLDALSCNGC